jgi:hypothetical protein
MAFFSSPMGEQRICHSFFIRSPVVSIGSSHTIWPMGFTRSGRNKVRTTSSHCPLRLPTMPIFMSQLIFFRKKNFYAGLRRAGSTLAWPRLRKNLLSRMDRHFATSAMVLSAVAALLTTTVLAVGALAPGTDWPSTYPVQKILDALTWSALDDNPQSG